ncbi:hypothetical protein NUU61_000510 [Penicillium alfredii]|uniref:Uncharacterized protein n=1 Tax=Penicillium alfredii TaxID=1506179 RepID=A0A9W9KR30_9EURO|nr:uncharacterized protein NUU61_000510 [Penicillium alfredii]KAJ5114751.1 hypothetical protein NUU61_000510 [Penicillium alfredii]
MADDLARLVHQIERVVTAPYAPSLQDLHELAHQCSNSTIESWAFYKPCQVGLLADVLVEGLSRSRVALPLVSAFASVTSFRDALLERHPVILDGFLEKTLDAEELEYYPACVVLLSSPLPSEVVPPARLSSFITKLVSRMAENPCAETITPLHTLINGLQGSLRILYELSSETLSNLQLEFTKTLRNLDDHMGNLLCLATFAPIASAFDTAYYRHHHKQQHGPEAPSWLLNIKHFFGPKRGMKTLDLVVLRVILACSSSCNSLTPSAAAESIRLAICIADALEIDQKQTWISGNSSKIGKLCEKIARKGLDDEIRMMGVVFLHTLLPPQSIPSQMRGLGLQTLISKDSKKDLQAIPPHLIPRLAESLADCGESSIKELLSFIFAALAHSASPSENTLLTIRLAHLILIGLKNTKFQPELTIINSTVFAIGTDTIGPMLEHFPAKPAQSQCDGSSTCESALSSAQNKLFLDLFDLYSSAALARNGAEDTSIKIMRVFVDRMEKSLSGSKCAFSKSKPADFRGSLALRDTPDFLSAHCSSRDWRAGFTDTFMKNAQTFHNATMKKAEELCFDLERRCYNTEAPLRAVEEERDGYIIETEELKRHNRELETQLQQLSSTISNLQQEIAQLGEHAEHACTRVEELSASLDSTHHALREQRCSSDEIIRVEKEKARTRELDLIATLTEKDDLLEELQEEVHSLQAENEQTRKTLDSVSKEKATSLDDSASLRREIGSLAGLLEESKRLSTLKEDEVKRLLTDQEDMRMELGNFKTTTEEQNIEIDRLFSALQKTEEQSRREIEIMKENHQAEASQAASENARHKEDIKRLQITVSDASKEAQTKDKRIQNLEKKIQSLRNERAAKAREFSEAQQHIGRLMAVMGFTAQPTEPKHPSRHQRSRSSVAPAPGASIPQPTRNEEDDMQLAQSFEYMTSNLSHPSPNRPRGSRLSIHPSQAPPSKNPGIAVRTPKGQPAPAPGTQKSVRKPLAETDRNSPSKSQSSQASKQSQCDLSTQEIQEEPENRLQEVNLDMDLESSRDFIFTSTAFSGSNDHPALH